MANHKSSVKRIRQDEARKTDNKYVAKSARNALKELRGTTDKAAAEELLPKVTSMLDKLAKKKVIHPNKTTNVKSEITKQVKNSK